MITTFEWRDRYGSFHNVKDMDTSYLYNALMMVYHNSMEKQYHVSTYKTYSFTPFYTPEYRIQAIKWMLAEIITRTDNTDARIEVVTALNKQFNRYLRNIILSHSTPTPEKGEPIIESTVSKVKVSKKPRYLNVMGSTFEDMVEEMDGLDD